MLLQHGSLAWVSYLKLNSFPSWSFDQEPQFLQGSGSVNWVCIHNHLEGLVENITGPYPTVPDFYKLQGDATTDGPEFTL